MAKGIRNRTILAVPGSKKQTSNDIKKIVGVTSDLIFPYFA